MEECVEEMDLDQDVLSEEEEEIDEEELAKRLEAQRRRELLLESKPRGVMRTYEPVLLYYQNARGFRYVNWNDPLIQFLYFLPEIMEAFYNGEDVNILLRRYSPRFLDVTFVETTLNGRLSSLQRESLQQLSTYSVHGSK